MVVETTGHWITALLLSLDCAWMSSEGRSNLVSLPDVHFSAAASIFTRSRLWVPSFDIGFTIDELDVVGALSITVSSSKLSAGIITISLVSSLFHINEVESTVDTTWQRGSVDGDGELLSEKLEHFVLRLGVEQVSS